MALQQRTRRTRENTAVLLIDHQVGLFTGVRDLTVSDLKHNVVALAKAAKVLGLPIVPVTTARDSMWGPTIPELKAVVGNDILDRSSVNAWDDARFVDAVKATKRNHLIIAGLSFEVCASFPAISAKEAGYEPVVALDACGTFSQDKRQAGIARLVTLGIEVSDYATLMFEMLGDNADPKANERICGAGYALCSSDGTSRQRPCQMRLQIRRAYRVGRIGGNRSGLLLAPGAFRRLPGL